MASIPTARSITFYCGAVWHSRQGATVWAIDYNVVRRAGIAGNGSQPGEPGGVIPGFWTKLVVQRILPRPSILRANDSPRRFQIDEWT